MKTVDFNGSKIDPNWLIQRKKLHPFKKERKCSDSLITGAKLSAIVLFKSGFAEKTNNFKNFKTCEIPAVHISVCVHTVLACSHIQDLSPKFNQ